MFENNFAKTQTYRLLKEAFAAECYAERRFKIFAKIARDEGLPGVETVFNELAHSQGHHADSHLDMLKNSDEKYYGFKIGNTRENMQTALGTELLEADECTGLLKAARDEKMEKIAERIESITLDEMSHIHRLNALLNDNISLS